MPFQGSGHASAVVYSVFQQRGMLMNSAPWSGEAIFLKLHSKSVAFYIKF